MRGIPRRSGIGPGARKDETIMKTNGKAMVAVAMMLGVLGAVGCSR
jgi:hypothetical protein